MRKNITRYKQAEGSISNGRLLRCCSTRSTAPAVMCGAYGMLMYEIWSLGHAPFGDSQPNQVAIGNDVHVKAC